jgi:heptosyltransferase-2
VKSCFTDILPWSFGVHEVERNLSLLQPLGTKIHNELPHVFPTDGNRKEVEQFLAENRVTLPFAVIAPGTVWETKRYPVGMMADVVRRLLEKFANVVIVGGRKDIGLVENFAKIGRAVVSAVGRFSIMSSAEIIRRASLLVANDSAPVHIAAAFNVPTVAIFGPTVRDFGFFPFHNKSAVVEVDGLGCRPCSIHGNRRCPIGTFDCMKRITPDEVAARAFELLRGDNG